MGAAAIEADAVVDCGTAFGIGIQCISRVTRAAAGPYAGVCAEMCAPAVI